MGDRVLYQVHAPAQNAFGPVVYAHWGGNDAPAVVRRLAARMATRRGDVDYCTARLVQFVIEAADPDSNVGVGVWNTDHLLTADDSHGDAGVVLINAHDGTAQYIGGYYADTGKVRSATEQLNEHFYTVLQRQSSSPTVG